MTRTLLIDPELRTIERIDADNLIETARKMLKCDSFDMGTRIADHGKSWDYLMVDDTGLSRGEPIHAFKFSIMKDPIAGRCLIFGVDKETRETVDAKFEVRQLDAVIDWLGLIKPEVTWVKDGIHTNAVVTYSRVS